jgi:hypothetical protein
MRFVHLRLIVVSRLRPADTPRTTYPTDRLDLVGQDGVNGAGVLAVFVGVDRDVGDDVS